MNKTISVLFATTIFTAPVLADQLRVVVDIPPVHGIVEGVLGSNASITTLISRGIDPHNYTMKPSHAAALSEADLIVLIGESLTPSLAEKLPSLASDAQIIELAEVSNVHVIAYEDAHEDHEDDAHHDDNHHDDHADEKEQNEHEHDEHHDDEHDSHDHSGINPHIWLDIDNADVWAHAIAKSASELSTALTSDINANLAAFEQALIGLKSEMQTLTAKPYSVSHDAFGYLEESFGIDHPQAVTNGMGLRPSPSDMANLRAQIEATPPACMIIDPNDHTALAYALAEEYSIKTVEFSQLGEIVEGENAYLILMQGAVTAFKTCFQ
ncbi:zinc ABC transporter substrate-binding protein [Paracoccaceae bacterium]|nr:zinc ABC transporter substrate-binding protein [Paracoccaceae bacterium]